MSTGNMKEHHLGRAVQAHHHKLLVFLNKMETVIKDLQETSFHRGPTDVTPEDEYALDSCVERTASEYLLYRNAFPNHLYFSVIVSWYSRLEGFLDLVCWREQQERKYLVSLSDLKKDGSLRSWIYLTKVVSLIPSTRLLELKDAVNSLREIRNFMVHQDGRLPLVLKERRLVPKEPKVILNYRRHHPGLIKVDTYGYLGLSHDYCRVVLAEGLEFARYLLFELGRTEGPNGFRLANKV